MRTRNSIALAASLCGTAAVVVGTASGAGGPSSAINPTPDRGSAAQHAALTFARAIVDDPKQLRYARFTVLPPFSNPVAVTKRRIRGFPRKGKYYGLLSTGDTKKIVRPNNSPDTSTTLGGPTIRGARDVTIVRIALRAPKNAKCLSLRFRFLSEEFPEFVDDIYNDAFIAELDTSNWDASGKMNPTITAPNSFATDSKGNPIRINTLGDASVNSVRAKGTTYDGGTRVLRASTPIKPGNHILYLSMLDQGDRQYDSTVLIDHLKIDRRSPCKSGAVRD